MDNEIRWSRLCMNVTADSTIWCESYDGQIHSFVDFSKANDCLLALHLHFYMVSSTWSKMIKAIHEGYSWFYNQPVKVTSLADPVFVLFLALNHLTVIRIASSKTIFIPCVASIIKGLIAPLLPCKLQQSAGSGVCLGVWGYPQCSRRQAFLLKEIYKLLF